MEKYLYGASVQGIQDFIFKTNKLQEIVGASEIVKNIAEDFTENYNPDDILLNAAGNIKAIFKNKEECEKVVLEFGKIIQQKAYGITISQAVVDMTNIKFEKQQDAIDELERKLKIQRNKPSIPLDSSINIMKLNPTTAKPMIQNDQDMATKQKLEAYKDIKEKENTDLHKLSNNKNKIAVIHIDGNGLGKIIPNLKKLYNLTLSQFSQKLDIATKKAFNDAKGTKKIREIILGGDDVTVICDANDALSFTQEFLTNFEKETKNSFAKLTACAGIAFCNEKYPFHYAVSLAETLCGVAKNDSNRESSCLMFHNIQSSNVQSWDKIIEDELTIKNDKQTIRCNFGAYYLDKENKPLILGLINSINAYRCDGSPSGRLRNWLSELYKSDDNAKNLLERINIITAQSGKWNSCIMDKNLQNINQELSSEKLIVDGKTPIYDILQILSITTSHKGEK
jgi:CRISPR/Cas system-associated protein Cas10 (large subunit of type III CRISPR-Cas system)